MVFRVVLDACVLDPFSLTAGHAAAAAETEVYDPCWSDRSLEEMARNHVYAGGRRGHGPTAWPA